MRAVGDDFQPAVVEAIDGQVEVSQAGVASHPCPGFTVDSHAPGGCGFGLSLAYKVKHVQVSCGAACGATRARVSKRALES